MCFQGIQHILRTCGLITAVAPQPRRNRELIKANQHHKRKYDYFLKQNLFWTKINYYNKQNKILNEQNLLLWD